jgi:hypothetical protein
MLVLLVSSSKPYFCVFHKILQKCETCINRKCIELENGNSFFCSIWFSEPFFISIISHIYKIMFIHHFLCVHDLCTFN